MPDGMLRVYYGAADTVIALAEAKIDDLIALCLEEDSKRDTKIVY
jgi:predicted GH43/DUF377 family glycosyl hydrolase